MGDLNALIQSNLALVTGGAAAVLVVLLVLLVVEVRRVGGLRRRLDAITRGEAGNLQDVLEAHLDKVYQVARELDELAARTAILEAGGRRAFQRIGLVRFNPFEETGGNQSFALAVLDADEHGFVISSLHARSGTRVYAKALTHGRAEAALSAEEEEALAIARNTTMGRGTVVTREQARRPVPAGGS